MNLLVIEDDGIKRTKIVSYLRELFTDACIRTARSYQSGLRSIVSEKPDWIVLDMAMPTFDTTEEDDGGSPQPFAGREILRQMERRAITIPTIIITQFDRFGDGDDSLTRIELDRQLAAAHPRIYRGTVYFDVTYDAWKTTLAEYMQTTLQKTSHP